MIPLANEKIITPKLHAQFKKSKGIKGDKWIATFDAVIVGSGAGGGVAAKTLSEAGWNVLVIEEGSYFTPSQFNDDEFLSHARLYRDAGFIVSEEQTISILQGRTLGGSTTVNWQTSLYPPKYVTDEWRKRFGWLETSEETMKPFVSAVRERLGVHDVPENLINENNKVIQRGAKDLGLHPEVLPNSNRGCIGLGRCGLGCPINAKQSVFLTWIPDAINAGATVFANFRVERIFDGKLKKILAKFTPDPYEKAPQEVIETLEINAKVVIISAGAIEGPALLLRSNLGNDWVGRNLKVHPTAAIFGKFDQEIKMFQGPPQSIVVKDGHNIDNSGYGYWLEAAPYRPTIFSSLVPFYGKTQFEVVRDFKNYNAGIVLVRDGADGETNGRVEWSWNKRKVHFQLTPLDGKHMLMGLKTLAQIIGKAGASHLVLPFPRLDKPFEIQKNEDFSWILQESIEPGHLTIGSAHPHGSIQSAGTPELGAIDPYFELYGHKNIFVLDASVFPTGLSVNPQITTMSVSLRAATRLSEQKQERLG